jgi:hypothetical protein
MKIKHKSQILFAIGVFLTLLMLKVIILVNEECIIPDVVGSGCIKSMVGFGVLLVLTTIAFFHFVIFTIEENRGVEKNEKETQN